MSDDSSIENLIPNNNNFGDVKRYFQKDKLIFAYALTFLSKNFRIISAKKQRFRKALDLQPEAPMEFKNPNDYYYDANNELSQSEF